MSVDDLLSSQKKKVTGYLKTTMSKCHDKWKKGKL